MDWNWQLADDSDIVVLVWDEEMLLTTFWLILIILVSDLTVCSSLAHLGATYAVEVVKLEGSGVTNL